ncbi:cyclophilin peptidyl-prolyl cis-trans isomerase Cyp8 [Neurospora sp. IMI 360204]|nr:cyclophilin peptidyl-prolyl cis-trans isomerase Cyp8 [Neurospora sp. IMI 360204]
MGKGTDKLYITHSEWSSSDAYGASTGANAGARAQRRGANFKKLPFNFCAASLQPFKNPVCTPDGTIFDVEVIGSWLEKHKTNPVNGEPLSAKDLIKLNFARNGDTTDSDENKGDLIDPVTFKVFTDNTHIVAIRHGSYANVFAWETVERMNIKAKMWRDLVDDEEFGRRDIITLQDPQNVSASRDLSQFKYLQDGQDAILTKEQEEQRKGGSVNIEALGRVGEKVLRAKEAVERARAARQAGGADVNRLTQALTTTSTGTNNKPTVARQSLIQERKRPANAATYTTGLSAASFTSTGLTPSTSGALALLSDEQYLLKPSHRIKTKGYVRMETNLGPLTLELLPEFAPKAVWNFLRLSEKGYYRDVAFHRSIRNFMIQGGDPSGTGRGGSSIWGKNFEDEFEGPMTHSTRGIVSMANKGKNTNSSQFFITYRPASHLDRKHTIFAKVIEGQETTLTAMENVPTDGSDRPLNKIVIKDVVVLIDPFAEWMKQKKEKEGEEERKREVARQGGTEDDRTTWTGKRIRADGTVEGQGMGEGGGEPKVGKYLDVGAVKKAAAASNTTTTTKAAAAAAEEEEVDTWEEPVRKKAKMGGFGNFDGW